MTLNQAWEKVRDFHRAFGHPYSDLPRRLPEDRVRARAKWMREEVEEFCTAGSLVDQADSMIDLIYFALGTLVEMGVRPEELFDVVHQSNMEKLWPDGKPHYDRDGKVVKPNGWQEPRETLKRVLEDLQVED